ncbi:hypothetical protein H4V96_003463 [Janthinobacterium sp. CG_23.4]|nr:hypothetical protein [Janthinobacterium sp. CG_23.4]
MARACPSSLLVVRQHGGTSQLHRASGGQGLLLEISLPLAPPG